MIQKFSDWAQKNPQAFLAIASAITAISVAILAVNFVMAASPFTLIALGLAALVTGVIVAYNTFETFRKIVNNVLNGLITGFEFFANAWINTINMVIRGMNILNPFTEITPLSNISLPRIGGGTAASVGSGAAREGGVGQVLAGMPAMPSMPSPSAPMAGGGGGGGGGGGSQGPGFLRSDGSFDYSFGNAERIANRPVTINVSGGISSAADIGRSVVDALTQYTQVYGPLDLAVR